MKTNVRCWKISWIKNIRSRPFLKRLRRIVSPRVSSNVTERSKDSSPSTDCLNLSSWTSCQLKTSIIYYGHHTDSASTLLIKLTNNTNNSCNWIDFQLTYPPFTSCLLVNSRFRNSHTTRPLFCWFQSLRKWTNFFLNFLIPLLQNGGGNTWQCCLGREPNFCLYHSIICV